MKGSQTPLCRRILAYLEDAVGALDFVPSAPASDKGAGQRGVVEIDRDSQSWRKRCLGDPGAIEYQRCPITEAGDATNIVARVTPVTQDSRIRLAGYRTPPRRLRASRSLVE